MVLNPLLAFVAGALTILSPCVLPLVPIVMGSAAQRGRFGPLVLAAGLVSGFTAVGMFAATVGASLGIDNRSFALLGAVLLICAGAVLAIARLQAVLAHLAAPLVAWAGQRQGALQTRGVAGQFGTGLLLGLVWSPCVGPTLGAAVVLATEGRSLVSAAGVMFAFALGVASVLTILAYGARAALARWRTDLLRAGRTAKAALGMVMIAIGVLVITGGDHWLETKIEDVSSDSLTALTTRY
ncbi:cytochrome c biogenesis CcdA family protein [Novosphingobium sp. FSW06-99]|uniref:cytochrome c biogenesis CcdA family protein n=1 Tax=Novosphingobium sp. FSW06-99 TaxID=1739113 RepID=UPI00076C7AEF|nr:cytochrome c biogenesis CcdA family protein [Novosphingobium sp. FSW06-99]KUR79777.1 cytochrome C biogenesis protein [Novosphingobium sp. FSW06-99]